MTRPMRPVLFGLLLVCATLAYGAQARNTYFLFIGDGMGFNHVELRRYMRRKSVQIPVSVHYCSLLSRDDTSVHTVGLSLDNLLFGGCHSFGDGEKRRLIM